jgi:hypothetical protein
MRGPQPRIRAEDTGRGRCQADAGPRGARVPLELRTIDPALERDALLAVLQRNLTDLDHARRFRWLYLDNPAGPARAWFLHETAAQRACGGSIPVSPLGLGARPNPRYGQVGDFAVDGGYRSLGPAVMLRRATFAPVDRRELASCYDCPTVRQQQGLTKTLLTERPFSAGLLA